MMNSTEYEEQMQTLNDRSDNENNQYKIYEDQFELANDRAVTTGQRKSKSCLQGIAFVVSLSSFIWGYSISVMNICISENTKGSIILTIPLTVHEQELVTSIVLIGAAVGAAISGWLSEKYGRRILLICTNFFIIIGTFLVSYAHSIPTLFIGRSIIGLSCGIVVVVVPTLLLEISPASSRGAITSLHQLQITIGILAADTIGYFCVSYAVTGWRYANLFILVPSGIQLALFSYIPESPRWLIRHDRYVEARKQLAILRPSDSDCSMKTELIEMNDVVGNTTPTLNFWRTVDAHKKILVVGIVLVFFQSTSGMNTVIFYSTKVFEFANVYNPLAATASVGSLNVIATLISLNIVDKFGRRFLLITGSMAMVISLLFLSCSLLLLDAHTYTQGIISIVCILIFVASFAIGQGVVVWVVLAEIVPTSFRSQAMGLFMVLRNIFTIFVATYTLSLIELMGSGIDPQKNGIAKLYLVCAIISLLSVLFVTRVVPETKSISLDSE